MNRNFPRALQLVLKHEGGWSDNPKDPGGATMKGVTLENFRRYVKANGTKDDLRKITDAQVAIVYKRFYWDAVKGDILPDGVDFAVFDFAINSGPSRAARYLQAVVKVTEDGKIGTQTMNAVRAMSSASIINQLCDDRLAFMKRIKNKQTGELLWTTFGKGWSKRVADVRSVSLAMAGGSQATVPVPTPKPTAKGAGLVAVVLAALAAIGAWFASLPCSIFEVFCR